MKKSRIKFNILDVLIVLVVIAAFVVCFKFIGAKAPEGESVLSIVGADDRSNVHYTVEIRRTLPEYKENYEIGDRVYDSSTGAFIGVVEAIEALPATESIADTVNGEYKLSTYEGREDVYVTLKAVPKITDKGIMVGKHNIKVGKPMKIQNGTCVGEGYVVDVRTDTEGGAHK